MPYAVLFAVPVLVALDPALSPALLAITCYSYKFIVEVVLPISFYLPLQYSYLRSCVSFLLISVVLIPELEATNQRSVHVALGPAACYRAGSGTRTHLGTQI